MRILLSRDKCLEYLPSLFTYSYQTICKTRDSFINWTCGKLPQCDFKFRNCFGFGLRFQNSFVRRYSAAPQTRYLRSIQIWRVMSGYCSFWSICWQFSWKITLRDTCNARRAPCTWLNLSLRLAAVGCTLQWTLVAEINKQIQLFAVTLTLTLRHSDVIVV